MDDIRSKQTGSGERETESRRLPSPSLRFGAVLAVLASVAALTSVAMAAQTTVRGSVSSSGAQGNGASRTFSSSADEHIVRSLSADGRYLAFYSDATNLVTGDTNSAADVFVRDLLGGTTTRVSVASNGTQANSASTFGSISADGGHIAFHSYATNLVPGDTNQWRDVFLHDLGSGETTRVSVATDGSQGNGRSLFGHPSANGRYVAFQSDASNLVTGDTNAASDVFIRDLIGGTTTRVSVSSAGAQGNGGSSMGSMSSDGRYVAFQSDASNLVPGDSNGRLDVFLRDLVSGTTTRVSLATSGAQGNNSSLGGSVSEDGQRVAFYSYASNLVSNDTNGTTDVFVRTIASAETTCVSIASGQSTTSGQSWGGYLSADGSLVAFQSAQSGVYATIMRNLASGQRTSLAKSSAGTPANANTFGAAFSEDNRLVAFDSAASNLVTGDTNGVSDVFVANLMPTAATLSKSPTYSGVTLVRHNGSATWTFGATLRTVGGDPIAGRSIVLEKSADAVNWKTALTRTTNASGTVSITLTYYGAGTSYWRWRFLGDITYAPSSTSKTKVVIR